MVPAPLLLAQGVRFSGPSDYDLAQQNPQQAAVADFDRDGWDDIAVTSAGWAQHGVRVFFNEHVGGFVAGAQLSTLGSPPVALACADFDGDGRLDLAAACSSGGNAVDWFRGLGARTFSGFQTAPGTGGLVSRRIVAIDADGDGLEELVLAHQTGLLLLRNTGSVSSRFTPVPAFPGSGGTQDVDVADMDRDGVLDVVALATSGSIRIWQGDGLGAFYARPGAQVTGGAYDLTLIDLDGNGSRDAFVTTLGGIELLFNGGIGSLAFAAAHPERIPVGLWRRRRLGRRRVDGSRGSLQQRRARRVRLRACPAPRELSSTVFGSRTGAADHACESVTEQCGCRRRRRGACAAGDGRADPCRIIARSLARQA